MKYSIILAILLITSCDDSMDFVSDFDQIPEDKYYSTDILSDNSEIYGRWRVIGTSGGFAGSGYPIDFDELQVKPNAIFGIVRNDSLLASGKIEELSDPSVDFYINFIPEEDPADLMIQLMYDTEKFVEFKGDSMLLFSPCCDRFDTHFMRID